MKVTADLKRKAILEREAKIYYDVYKDVVDTVAVLDAGFGLPSVK